MPSDVGHLEHGGLAAERRRGGGAASCRRGSMRRRTSRGTQSFVRRLSRIAPRMRAVQYVLNWKPREMSKRSIASISPNVPMLVRSSTSTLAGQRRGEPLGDVAHEREVGLDQLRPSPRACCFFAYASQRSPVVGVADLLHGSLPARLGSHVPAPHVGSGHHPIRRPRDANGRPPAGTPGGASPSGRGLAAGCPSGRRVRRGPSSFASPAFAGFARSSKAVGSKDRRVVLPHRRARTLALATACGNPFAKFLSSSQHAFSR